MPRKKYICKKTKKSRSARKVWEARKTALQLPDQNVTETSEETFERLLQETRSTSMQSSTSTPLLPDTPANGQIPSYSDDSDDPDFDISSLIIEPMDIDGEDEAKITGRRIVDMNHILRQMEEMAGHSKRCTMGRYVFQSEIVSGLFSKWVYYCDNCEKNFIVTSEQLDHKEECNDAFVWGALSIGIGYAQAQEMLSVMDIPIMGAKKFRSHERRIGQAWEEKLVLKMRENAEEEKKIAIEKGNFLNGIPYITVIGDGGWAKRSYGHGMNAASGVGAIIGAHTKKLLFLGVRNKFCFVCSKNKNKKIDIPDHDCYLNYKGSSTGMESSIIVEGFKRSEEDYGLLYRFYVGDGDSSVFTRIQENCKYGRFVRKIECANHMTRCLNDKLHKLAVNTLFLIESRKMLSATNEGSSITRIERIVRGVRTAIKRAGETKSTEEIKKLQQEIRNSVDHVFGRHDLCSNFCSKKESKEDNLLNKLNSEFLLKIRSHLESLEKNAETLAFNQTTNVAERFMGIVAKFTGGKRVNYSTSGSFKRRCYGAGLSHTKGPSWHLSPWKSMHNRSPGKVFKTRMQAREKNRARRALLTNKPRKRKISITGYNSEYGPLTVEPDLPEEELSAKCESFLDSLNITKEDAANLERNTVGQHANVQWQEARMNRLTASRFGVVAKRMPHTSCHNLVKTILYPKKLMSDAISFGKQNESVAIKMYEEKMNTQVQQCGFFVDTTNPYLGASPDGLVGEKGLVEVKCLYSVKDVTLQEAVESKKQICLQLGTKKQLFLKRNHNYYYQVQGQLNITQREWCDFVVYTRQGELFIERILKDEDMWKGKVFPKLAQFYKDCILPEIVDSRVVRGMKIRDPLYIIEAQESKTKNKTKLTEN